MKRNSGRQAVYTTESGTYHVGDANELLATEIGDELRGQVQLILTSPPFPLNKKKSYGNLEGDTYKTWFQGLAKTLSDLLAPDGSIVVEIGNAWMAGRPVQSLLHLEALIGLVNDADAGLRLCQEFICYNPSRLPSPAEWVTIRRIRVWWMAKTDFPKADNRKVLRAYSHWMKDLLKRQRYNSGRRPSEHTISPTGFLVDHGGSIMPNVLELEPIDPNQPARLPNVFKFSNTNSNDFFLRACHDREIVPHPARMPLGLAAFFIEFLTDPDDLVLDPFAGSNTTGFAAELLRRRWVAIDVKRAYAEQSLLRFEDPLLKKRDDATGNGDHATPTD